jgi:hypothetical protein
MTKTRVPDWRMMPRTVALAAIASLAGAGVQASARGVEAYAAPPATLYGSSSSVGQSMFTPRGPGFVTGSVGSMDTVTLPGSAGQGFLMNNGNGSSTLFGPGGVPQTVITPR